MISRSPSLFQIGEGEAQDQDQAGMPTMTTAGELVGLQLIIQPSPRRQQRPPLAVLRRSSVRSPAANLQESSGGQPFVGLEFLKCCLCCCKKIDVDMDVFVYKGQQAFCSAECRCQHMAREERREIEILVRKRRDAFHNRRAAPGKTVGGSDRHPRVQISSFC
ncbi:FCS-Like Zinc finger 17-like [Hordeum vulgare subsp. vulgare]|uniref:FLZ-type domain-containing protein n=1 Tax=Hordeum vulgare subsp. vulgare TaxID=112509 RepID=A0A8I6X4X6_HORVV|nr:FCS-Like Zinc finger 17-like [Hordeum vulgare subsp. vulgare]